MYIKLTLQEKLKDERTSRRMTLAELEARLGLPVVPIEDHGAKFVERILCGSWRNER